MALVSLLRNFLSKTVNQLHIVYALDRIDLELVLEGAGISAGGPPT